MSEHERIVCEHCKKEDCGDATCSACGAWWVHPDEPCRNDPASEHIRPAPDFVKADAQLNPWMQFHCSHGTLLEEWFADGRRENYVCNHLDHQQEKVADKTGESAGGRGGLVSRAVLPTSSAATSGNGEQA